MSAKANKDWSVLGPQLDQLLGLSSPEQERWLGELERQGGASAANASQLRSLLSARDEASRAGFMLGVADPEVLPPTLAQSGDALGAWALDRLLGEGGMGTVWLARRADGRFEGQAAIKLLRTGLFDRSAQERFKREGGILARLHHPGIAALLDAGVSERGQPYLVLEYVQGQRIDRYCDAAELGIRQRVELFLQVLDAVAAAHAQLIIHRDLKPSNILVDEGGRVRLLDFGLARLQEESEGQDLTRGWALTPEYAAPEQFTGAPLSQATDVFSLGVVLFELLTGQRPHELAAGSGMLDYLQVVQRGDLRMASQVSPDRAHALRGDLDMILVCCLRAEQAKRYVVVAELKADLCGYLADLPIRARPLGWLERSGKLLRRNAAWASGIALSVVAVLVGLVSSSWMAVQAQRSAELASLKAAEAQAQQAIALQKMGEAQDMSRLFRNITTAVPAGKPLSAQGLLDLAASATLARSDLARERQASLLRAVADSYLGLGAFASSEQAWYRAYELTRKHPDPGVRALSACGLAAARSRSRQFIEAKVLISSSLQDLPTGPAFVEARIVCLLNAADLAQDQMEADQGLRYAQDALALLPQMPLASPEIERDIWYRLADSYRQSGQVQESLQAYAQIERLVLKAKLELTVDNSNYLHNWALLLFTSGQPLPALRLLEQRQALVAHGEKDSGLPLAIGGPSEGLKAQALMELGLLDQADAALNRSLAINRSMGNQTGEEVGEWRRIRWLRLAGKLDQAHAQLRKFAASRPLKYAANHPVFGLMALERALQAQAGGDDLAAALQFDQGIAQLNTSPGARMMRGPALLRRAEFHLARHAFELARHDASEAAKVLDASLGQQTLSMHKGDLLTLQGKLQQQAGADGHAEFVQALRHYEHCLGPDHAKTLSLRRLASGAG